MDIYKDIFDKYDFEILQAPFVEYNENNLPEYYPENGIWFNQNDVEVERSLSDTDVELNDELETLANYDNILKKK